MNKDLHQLNELAQNTIVSTTISKNRLQRNIMRMKKVLHSTNATVKSIAMLLMGVLFFANSWGQSINLVTGVTNSNTFLTVGTGITASAPSPGSNIATVPVWTTTQGTGIEINQLASNGGLKLSLIHI